MTTPTRRSILRSARSFLSIPRFAKRWPRIPATTSRFRRVPANSRVRSVIWFVSVSLRARAQAQLTSAAGASLFVSFPDCATSEALGAAPLDLGRFGLARLGEIYHRLLACRRCVGDGALDVGAIRLHFPLASIRPQLDVEHRAQFLAQLRILDRRDDLDPAFQIALHAIGGTDEIFFSAAVAEVVDAPVFEESADDAHDTHGFRQPRDSRPQPARVADYQLDLHSRLRRPIERSRDIHVLERVHLELDQSGSRGRAGFDLALDSRQ